MEMVIQGGVILQSGNCLVGGNGLAGLHYNVSRLQWYSN